MTISEKQILILYHGECHDGFGGAYAAWKKFGDKAEYVPLIDREKPPQGLAGKEVYLIDYSYPGGILLELEQKTERLVVLDHHSGREEAVMSAREHVFTTDQSGAGIAWRYFHSDKKLPKLLAYIEDNDLWKFALPHAVEVECYLGIIPFDFKIWDTLAERFEDEVDFLNIVKRGEGYREYSDYIYHILAEEAEVVEFEGYQVLAVNAPRFFCSNLGNILAAKHAPLGIVWYQNNGMWHFSLRGDGSVDCAELANRYGGSGSSNAAGFRLPLDAQFPFKVMNKKGE